MKIRKSLRILSIALITTSTLCIFFVLYRSYTNIDGLTGWIFSNLLDLKEDTVYSKSYSHLKFEKIEIGMDKDNVVKIIGKPLHISFIYTQKKRISIYFEDDKVSEIYGTDKVDRNMSKSQVITALGYPSKQIWNYSKSPGDTHYRMRILKIKENKVVEIINSFYVD